MFFFNYFIFVFFWCWLTLFFKILLCTPLDFVAINKKRKIKKRHAEDSFLHDESTTMEISTSQYVTQENDLIDVASTSTTTDKVVDDNSGGSGGGSDDDVLSLQNDDPNLIAYNEENVEFISLLDKGNQIPKYVVHEKNNNKKNETQQQQLPRILVNVSIATDNGKGTLVHAVYQLHVEVPATADFPIPIPTFSSPSPSSTSTPSQPIPPSPSFSCATEQQISPPPASLTLLSPSHFVVDIDDEYTESPIIISSTEENSTPNTTIITKNTTTTAMSNDENEVDDVITTSATELATPISFEENVETELKFCANHTIPYVLILEGESTHSGRHTNNPPKKILFI